MQLLRGIGQARLLWAPLKLDSVHLTHTAITEIYYH